MKKIILLSFLIVLSFHNFSQNKNKFKTPLEKTSLNGLKFRSVGPALTAGRIADIAVNPKNSKNYYLAVASGGVWKTENSGNTYEPIFDSQGSYSIGCITIDPSNEHVIWVGTGENNNQRSVAYGDGVYKSLDGGKSWKNMGLKSSEHIGMIVVDPNNSNIVFVAAYGPLWKEGGERGLYKTENAGKDWTLILETDENTGVNEIHLDPRNSNIMYATTHQRRRHVFTYVGGGPGSQIYKSNDGGENWKELNGGLPSSIKGRIGMDISPVNPDLIYALVEAEKDKQGLYVSKTRGESWEKINKYVTSGNYYQEVFCDPVDENKVFFMDTWLHYSSDGGKSIVKTGEKSKHVDNHCIWIDPLDTEHWIVGCDGGVYETWDHAKNWHFKPNLPITQFYKVAVDNEFPFYNIYGGTQDNNSLGGPSRTISNHGILNSDWYITNGGDGFESAIDPENSNIVYAQSQYGWLVRYDKLSGEKVGIKPMASKGMDPLRWNWDAPLLISPHNNKRLYFAANRLFRSDSRGDKWDCISPDLSRGIDRNQLKVMGRVQSADAVMKNKSTTMYGNIVALDESPIKENLLYVGTDDGLIHVTKNAGKKWITLDEIKELPKNTYVNSLVASKHDSNRVYAVFNNHKRGDFKPYVYVSNDVGKTWKSIVYNLPAKQSVYDISEDHISQDLLFVGTELGVYFTNNRGLEWKQLNSGLPTIAVRDLEIQERENDLVLATFGRSFYVLDDYSPLRSINVEEKSIAKIFPIKDAIMYVDSRPLGLRGKGSQGESMYNAKNPPLGAVFTYYFKDTLRTSKSTRQKQENIKIKNNEDVSYPSLDALRNEDREESPFLLFTIYNDDGNEIRKLVEKPKLGVNRLVWNFRHTSQSNIQLKSSEPGRYGESNSGPLALPGTYYISMHKVVNGIPTLMVDKTPFKCTWLDQLSIPSSDKEALLAFGQKVQRLRKAVDAAGKVLEENKQRINFIKSAFKTYPGLNISYLSRLDSLNKLRDIINVKLYGDPSLSKRDIEQNESISSKVGIVIWNMWRSRSNPTETNLMLYELASEEFKVLLAQFNNLDKRISKIESYLEQKQVPFTPGRGLILNWKKE
jgi:photosystem II stability/assembly factor-like uncharacterized protein